MSAEPLRVLPGHSGSHVANYYAELTRAMTMLSDDPRTVFIGQSVGYPGTGIYGTLADVPSAKRIELPVMEDCQIGMSTGMALAGLVPITIYPRWNFLLLAANGLVNHLDRLPIYSNGGYRPRVIVRVAVPSVEPLDPQSQHDADFTEAFRAMLRTTDVVNLTDAEMIFPAYEKALHRTDVCSTVLVEHVSMYAA